MDKRRLVILRVALDTPLRRVFDYLPPAAGPDSVANPGVRVRVPFGRRQVVGILVEVAADSPIDAAKLKRALEILDSRPVFDAVTFELLRWAADYYHHPLGEVMAAALPANLRGGQAAQISTEVWTLTPAGTLRARAFRRQAGAQTTRVAREARRACRRNRRRPWRVQAGAPSAPWQTKAGPPLERSPPRLPRSSRARAR